MSLINSSNSKFTKTIRMFTVGMTSLGLLMVGTSISASELKLKVDAGYDDNPFRLSSRFNPKGSEYIEAAIRGELDLSKSFFFHGNAKHRAYGSDSNDADSTRAMAGFGHRVKGDWVGERSQLESKLSAGYRDKTYVSRLSGEIGSSGEELIEDRYDYKFFMFESDLKVKWSKANRSKFYFEVEKRDYEDYSNLGLSNFDYIDFAIGADWRHKFSKQSSFKIGLEKSFRDFDDRRERDVQGNSIADSDLTYDAWQANLGYTYKIAKTWRFAFNAQYDLRSDSGPGYYDWDRIIVGLSTRYTPDEINTYRASVSYSEDTYDKRAENAGVDDEELSEQMGYRYKLGYERKLSWAKGLSFRANYRYDDIDADLTEYRYDRHQVSLGIGYEF